MRDVRRRLLADRPAPGDAKSLQSVYDQLCFMLVNPEFLRAVNDVLDHGLYAGLDVIQARLTSDLRPPTGADREELVALIVDTLQRYVGRAQRDDKSAIDVATAFHGDRVLARADDRFDELETQIQGRADDLRDDLDRLTGRLAGPRLLDLGDLPTWTQKAMRELSRTDPDGYEWLLAQTGEPQDSARVERLVDDWPDRLANGSAILLQAVARQAESAALWTRAAEVWKRLGRRYIGEQAADHLVRAAIDLGVGGDQDGRLALLEAARDEDSACVRLQLEELDQRSSPQEQLEALAGLHSDDTSVGALIACQRAMACLLIVDLRAAERHLKEAELLDHDALYVRSTRVNLTIQQARVALRSDRPFEMAKLRAAQSEARSLRDELLGMGRYEESMRLLMLAAEVDGLLHDPRRMRELLREARSDELRAPEAAEVLGDAALRAGDDRLALRFVDDVAPETEGIRRIRLTATTQTAASESRLRAVDELEAMALAGGSEDTLAALARLQACFPPVSAAWSAEVEAVLLNDGYRSVAVGLHAMSLCARGRAIDAEALLAGLLDEVWVAELRVRVAGARGAHGSLRDAAARLMLHAPHASARLLAGRAFTEGGDLPQALQTFLGVANDLSAPPAVRADAFHELLRTSIRADEWDVATRSLESWQQLSAGHLSRPDPRINAWQVRVLHHNRTSRPS